MNRTCVNVTRVSRVLLQGYCAPMKVDIRLLGKGNSNSHGARPVYYNHLDD